MAATEKTDRLAMCLFRALLDADRQTKDEPMVFWRYLQQGFENYLHGEGYSGEVAKAIGIADAKVRIGCFCIDPAELAEQLRLEDLDAERESLPEPTYGRQL